MVRALVTRGWVVEGEEYVVHELFADGSVMVGVTMYGGEEGGEVLELGEFEEVEIDDEEN